MAWAARSRPGSIPQDVLSNPFGDQQPRKSETSASRIETDAFDAVELKPTTYRFASRRQTAERPVGRIRDTAFRFVDEETTSPSRQAELPASQIIVLEQPPPSARQVLTVLPAETVLAETVPEKAAQMKPIKVIEAKPAAEIATAGPSLQAGEKSIVVQVAASETTEETTEEITEKVAEEQGLINPPPSIVKPTVKPTVKPMVKLTVEPAVIPVGENQPAEADSGAPTEQKSPPEVITLQVGRNVEAQSELSILNRPEEKIAQAEPKKINVSDAADLRRDVLERGNEDEATSEEEGLDDPLADRPRPTAPPFDSLELDLEKSIEQPLPSPGLPAGPAIVAETDGYDRDCRVSREYLLDRTLADISLDIAVGGVPGEDFPVSCDIETRQMPINSYRLGQQEPLNFAWTASGLCHKPLYFREIQAERYGHTIGPISQPFLSAAHFFCNAAILPYKMGMRPPQECVYALGHYWSGNPAPRYVPAVPISIRGGIMQAGAVLGAVYVLP